LEEKTEAHSSQKFMFSFENYLVKEFFSLEFPSTLSQIQPSPNSTDENPQGSKNFSLNFKEG